MRAQGFAACLAGRIGSGDPSPDDDGGSWDARLLRDDSGRRSDMVCPETIEGAAETSGRDHETIRWLESVCHQNAVYSPARPRSTELPQMLNLPHFRHVDRS